MIVLCIKKYLNKSINIVSNKKLGHDSYTEGNNRANNNNNLMKK